MTHCGHCGEYLSVSEEWRLRPEIEPGTLETEVEEDFDNHYMHPECRKEYKREGQTGSV